MKRNTKVQWMNLQQNSSFINRTRFPLLCERSGAILLVLVGLMAGSQMKFKIFKISLQIVSLDFSRNLTKVQFCYSITQTDFSRFFCEKYIVRHVMDARHVVSC